MTSMLLGITTVALNNLIDSIFVLKLLMKNISFTRSAKKGLWIYFGIVVPLISGISFVYKDELIISEILYELTLFPTITIIPALTARNDILKYELCYGLSRLWVAVVSYAIQAGIVLITKSEKVYFYVSRVKDLPVWLAVNFAYLFLTCIGYKLCCIIVRGYRKNSKVQNGIAIAYLVFTYVVETCVYYAVVTGVVKNIAAYMVFFFGVLFASLEVFVLALYQSSQITKENELIKRHREKEKEYYKQLEKDQLVIRKMCHDMMNYLQTMQNMEEDEERKKQILQELEEQFAAYEM